MYLPKQVEILSMTPVEEMVRALDDAVRAGKINV
jgi:aryl-alcohol dehydrogenase-like predicted oxidoreductase